MTMPFGKFRGWAIADLPDDYLTWLRTLDDLREPLRAAVRQEWHARFEEGRDPAEELSFGLDAEERALLARLMTAGYRALSLKLHPDMGGSVEAMQRLNALMEKLRSGVLTA